MSSYTDHIVLLSLILMASRVSGQLSPGPLTAAHQDLEGTVNCTQCHDIGNGVPDQKCLECHSEIAYLINVNRGLHASEKAQKQTCVDCHSEHHGRKFDMMRFDEDNFNHLETGYSLDGMHGLTDCRTCHKSDNIVDEELKWRKNTFLGLQEECLSCHMDFHQGTLSKDCISCHNFQDFIPAPGFDHDAADYPLLGAHQEVDCVSCHPVTFQNGQVYQEFVDLSFNDCNSCHEDPHQNRIKGKCISCHTENTFANLRNQNEFNHNTTAFELRGAHKSITCFDCHSTDSNPKLVFSDHKGLTETQCIICHEDEHEGALGTDCAGCHNENSFTDVSFDGPFDHNQTDFPLEGLHIDVQCQQCHVVSYSEPIPHQYCKNCHEDYHNGEFVRHGLSPDCIECHSPNEGFNVTFYGIEEHNESKFPLEGAHLATPCVACHRNDDNWNFKEIGNTCVDCHSDIHLGIISEKYYPEQSCNSCHGPDSWSDISFDHTTTDWPLNGRHQDVSCHNCHFKIIEGANKPIQTFANLSTNCNKCHDNPHGTQFDLAGSTDCKRCHNSNNWSPAIFNHNQTDFPLDGKHAEVECNQCHIPEKTADGTYINYKIQSFECVDCHS